ncbi:Pex19 protein family [Schizosaccharomyces cryophilus OY26]|uniref:Pex19 protein family n=1 Tax=Schizosaccharomyces cryophilus (strain OY26 / ATCC MYA-4695 / CBS 11777 / NBRC 106824 / NRRL Y48691) TaxID=653667 RepID=S9XDR4_SCHCR|nr:Pex19 protein family [Schizosaccharomyces cryophilus OY26]EPY51906.1 Pex19 protein family [Schizosaccharomyces cryophilus OY26]
MPNSSQDVHGVSNDSKGKNEVNELDDILDELDLPPKVDKEEGKQEHNNNDNDKEPRNHQKGSDGNLDSLIEDMMDKFQGSGNSDASEKEKLASMGLKNDNDLFQSIFGNTHETDGASNSEGINYDALENALNSLMSQVTSKDILYEPLKDLEGKYKVFFEDENNAKNEAYGKQFLKIQRCIGIFENPDYQVQRDSPQIAKLVEEIQEEPLPPSLMDSSFAAAGCPLQ